jgi:hypothetical protein
VAPGVLAISDALRLEWRNFLARTHWDHFATLTSRVQLNYEDFIAEFKSGFIRRLTRVTQCPVSFFVVVEPTYAELWHGHALLAGTAHLKVDRAARAWHKGWSRVKLITDQRRAICYTTKQLEADAPDRLDFRFCR